jgi:hypothetical protein
MDANGASILSRRTDANDNRPTARTSRASANLHSATATRSASVRCSYNDTARSILVGAATVHSNATASKPYVTGSGSALSTATSNLDRVTRKNTDVSG